MVRLCGNFDLQQLVGFTYNLLQSFKAPFEKFRKRNCLVKFITHPHECAEGKADLSYLSYVRSC